MTRYAVDIDLDDPNLSHTQVVDLVGRDRTVLDLGCAAGALAQVLTARGCTVSGVEARASAADDRLRWVEGRLRRSRARANRLQKQVREMQGSATWRVGRLLTRPFRRTP